MFTVCQFRCLQIILICIKPNVLYYEIPVSNSSQTQRSQHLRVQTDIFLASISMSTAYLVGTLFYTYYSILCFNILNDSYTDLQLHGLEVSWNQQLSMISMPVTRETISYIHSQRYHTNASTCNLNNLSQPKESILNTKRR